MSSPATSPSRPSAPLARAEWLCLAGLAALAVLAVAVPPIAQPASYHAFADARAWRSIPNAANVLSNLGFVAAGSAILIGLALPGGRAMSQATRIGLLVTGIGILFTAWGSAHYHWAPGNATLFWDRLPMTVTFSGIVAVVLSQRVSARSAWIALPLLLVLGPVSVLYWSASGNVVPYGVFQAGSMLGLMLIVPFTRRGDDRIPWWWIIAGYALAKVAETFDGAIFDAAGHVVSGHTLKHLFAGLAVAGFAWPLRARLGVGRRK